MVATGAPVPAAASLPPGLLTDGREMRSLSGVSQCGSCSFVREVSSIAHSRGRVVPFLQELDLILNTRVHELVHISSQERDLPHQG